jgi:carboxyl-terminal processing protease
MIAPGPGYVRLQEFSETTDTELSAALKKLKAAGMQRLRLDIRDNGGGPLNQAIAVANHFLHKGQMIVYTKGRVENSDEDYRAVVEGDYTDLPLIVMTSRQSASASEIVTGSMQDHDRAIIVGETTFGKALVQSVYSIEGAGLALTTAHYYTPSGRLIQRPWDATFDEYLSYRSRDQEAVKTHSPSDMKRTDAGRAVYSGGGIEPDKCLTGAAYEGFNPTQFGRLLYNRGEFENYAIKFSADGDSRVAQAATGRKIVKPDFVVDDEMVADFRQQLQNNRLKIDEEAFQKDLTFIKGMIRYRIDEALFGIAAAKRHLIAIDPQAILGVSSFSEVERLNGLGKGSTRPAN